MEYQFKVNQKSEVFDLVKTHHYSHLIPSSVQKADGLFLDDRCVAGIIWGTPASRWKEPVLELQRLCRLPDMYPPLTYLISQSCKQLKQLGKDLLISYADSTQGHHGGVYQAASWNYDGSRGKNRLEAFIIDGIKTHCRVCNHRYGTSSIKLVQLLQNKGIEAVPYYSQQKYLYWRALNKKGEEKAIRLGLKKLPYPKETSDGRKANHDKDPGGAKSPPGLPN